MSDCLDLLRRVDSVLTRVTLRYPDSWGLLWKQHKHVRYSIENQDDPRVRPEKTLHKSRDWLIGCLVNHPMFDEDFRPIANDITDFFKDQQKI